MEKAYKTMQSAGTGNIVLGIVAIVTGAAAGIILIINGARLLKNKNQITF